MKKNLIKNFSLVLLLIILITGCAVYKEETPFPLLSLQIGICPTMQEEIFELSEKYPSLEIIKYDSSAMAIHALQAKEIDVVLVGRKPFSQEISSDLEYHQLKPGATLVSQKQGFIKYEDLSKITVHTSLKPKEAEKMLPKGSHVVYFQGSEISYSEEVLVVLKDWDQVGNDERLLTPVNYRGEKIRIFRTPFLIFLKNSTENLGNLRAVILPNN
jgi:hypothetical protein